MNKLTITKIDNGYLLETFNEDSKYFKTTTIYLESMSDVIKHLTNIDEATERAERIRNKVIGVLSQ